MECSSDFLLLKFLLQHHSVTSPAYCLPNSLVSYNRVEVMYPSLRLFLFVGKEIRFKKQNN